MNILARLKVRWHAVAVAFVAALPILLQQLQVIDLKPILSHFMSPDYVALLIGLMPFILAFLKPMVEVAPKDQPSPS